MCLLTNFSINLIIAGGTDVCPANVGSGRTLQPKAEVAASRYLRCPTCHMELGELVCNTTHTSKWRRGVREGGEVGGEKREKGGRARGGTRERERERESESEREG